MARDSAEAKAHFASKHNFQEQSKHNDAATQQMRNPVKKRPSKLMTATHKPAKLNVLEKSRLDWAGFVDKEGISDELKQHNKDGYVERQEFLRRSDDRRQG